MEEQCKQAIYAYVNEQTQLNAVLFGEHTEYVQLVIKLIRADYHGQVNSGANEYVITNNIADILSAECPW